MTVTLRLIPKVLSLRKFRERYLIYASLKMLVWGVASASSYSVVLLDRSNKDDILFDETPP